MLKGNKLTINNNKPHAEWTWPAPRWPTDQQWAWWESYTGHLFSWHLVLVRSVDPQFVSRRQLWLQTPVDSGAWSRSGTPTSGAPTSTKNPPNIQEARQWPRNCCSQLRYQQICRCRYMFSTFVKRYKCISKRLLTPCKTNIKEGKICEFFSPLATVLI